MSTQKVLVLMGGRSSEYEVSLASGNEILKNINRKKYFPIPLVISKNGDGLDKIFEIKPNVVFIALHGAYGEDGKIQGLLESLGISYTGSGVLPSAIGMDKILFKKLMLHHNISVPKPTNKFPCFVKPADQGSSVGTAIAKNKTELNKALNIAKKYSNNLLIEEYLSGMEITCAILGNGNPYTLPLVEIVPKKNNFFDYQSKYTESGADEIVPARISKSLTKKVSDLALQVYKIVGCRGFARVDFILKDGKNPIVLEINTIPGLTPTSLFPKAAKAFGMTYSQLIDNIIKYATF